MNENETPEQFATRRHANLIHGLWLCDDGTLIPYPATNYPADHPIWAGTRPVATSSIDPTHIAPQSQAGWVQ